METKEVLIEKEFSFPLTESEFATKGKRAAELSKEMQSITYHGKVSADSFKHKIKTREAECSEILKCIQEGSERRKVKTIARYNYETRIVGYYFNEELMEERPMTETEAQLELKGTHVV